jgi:hypothetical protein
VTVEVDQVLRARNRLGCAKDSKFHSIYSLIFLRLWGDEQL